MARCGITARRTSGRSIARRWCCWSGRCRPRNVKLYRLPACRAACVVHPSDEEDFASARAAAKAAVANQPFEIEGPMRERYFSSAGDSRFDLTEIQFPLRITGALP